MANIKVSEMTEATSFDDGDYTMIVQANQNKKIAKENIFSDLKNEITTNATNISNINDEISDINTEISNIIESGSNANGNWIKYSDGTMLCWKTYTFSGLNFTTAWGPVYETAYQEFGATPQTFIAIPTIFANNGNGAMAGIEGLNNTTTNSFGRTQLYRPVSGTASGSINLLAIGKWK